MLAMKGSAAWRALAFGGVALLSPVSCSKGDGKSPAVAATASSPGPSPASSAILHSCLVGGRGRRSFCREIHHDGSAELVDEAKATCDALDGQLYQGSNPCPSDFATRCVRRLLKETRYGYDPEKIEQDRAACGGDEFSAR